MDTSKKDLYYTITIAVVVLLAVITFWLGGKGNEIVSYVSFASALISIVLALVAIFYSIVQNVNSQQNIGEMRTLVSEVSRLIAEKADTIANLATSMDASAKQLIEVSPKISGPIKPLVDETFRFDASNAPTALLLAFYYLAKCHELKKPMQLGYIAELISSPDEILDWRRKMQLYLYGVGVLSCLKCFWESDSMFYQDEGHKIEKIPHGFQENISSIITSRLQDFHSDASMRRYLETRVKKIDALVEAA